MTDIAVYVDVWRSLNGRFQQRLVDPRVDILSAVWSPWRPTSWLMPLLTELTPWRSRIFDLEQLAMQQSQSIRVAFVADFPGSTLFLFRPVYKLFSNRSRNSPCVIRGFS